ncbi:MAG TPA: hypothetical protein VFX21_05195 [Acidimicrobiia bacterium]|nr:hypothetical protein [Acidimicrobiia bacterium]
MILLAGSALTACSVRSSSDRSVAAASTTTVATAVGAPDPVPEVVTRLTGNRLPSPLALADGDAWLGMHALEGDRPVIRLERRAFDSGALIGTVDVPQEGGFAMASYKDVVYLVGGGDGAVPETTISALDARDESVVFTRALETPCSCAIAVNDAGVWLGANGGNYLVRADRETGKQVAEIELPRAAITISADEEFVRAALDDGTTALVDPATNAIAEISPVDPTGLTFTPRSTAVAGDGTWSVGAGNRIARTRDGDTTTYILQPDDTFDQGADELQFASSQYGFDQVVGDANRLWIAQQGAVLVVEIPA